MSYVAYTRVAKNLHIRYAKDYPFIQLECIEKTPKIKLKATETVQIVNNSINFIKVEIEDLNNGLIINKGEAKNLDSLLKVKEEKTVVPVTNTRDRKIILNKNKKCW